ncbi:SIR2 family NAD-dependent protein deacylase [Rhodanobacter sp. UC4450_H17]
MQKNDPIVELAHWFRAARSVVVLTGAGMSAESGIPTFRDAQNGLWLQFDPEDLSTASAFQQDKALVWGWYVWRMAMVRAAQPHAGHRALAELANIKPGLSIVTQNVDDLHERAGARDVVHLHGNLFASRCFACGRPHEDVHIPSEAAHKPLLRLMPPRCTHCGGYVRPGVVWFGEPMPQLAWRKAERCATASDLLIAIGTSGLVFPAASLPGVAKQRGAKVVEINPLHTQLTDQADLALRSTAGEALSGLVNALTA